MFLGSDAPHSKGRGRMPRPPNSPDLIQKKTTNVHTARETAAKFYTGIKLDVRRISTGSPMPAGLAKIFGDANADAQSVWVANLLLKTGISFAILSYDNTVPC